MPWNDESNVGSNADWGGAEDYTTIQLWENTLDSPATPADGDAVALCRGDVQSANIYLAGYLSGMSSSVKMVIKADAGYETTGGITSPSSEAEVSGRLICSESTNAFYLDISGLKFTSNSAPMYIGPDGGGELHLTKCWVAAGTNTGIHTQGVASGTYAVNIGACLAVDRHADSYAYGFNAGYSIAGTLTTTIVQSTSVGADIGMGCNDSDVDAIFTNCVAGDSNTNTGGADFVNYNSNSFVKTTCAWQNDASANMDSDDFNDIGSDDYRAADSGYLDGNGTDFGDLPQWFQDRCTTDLAGESWEESNMPIGCYGVPAAAGVEVSATLDALVLTEYAATVNKEISLSAGVDSLVLTEYSPTVGIGINVSAGVDALAITEYAAGVNKGISFTAGLDALALTEYAATVYLSGVTIAGVLSASFVGQVPTMNFVGAVPEMTFVGKKPSITFVGDN